MPFKNVTIDGGLDLVTPAQTVKPGSLLACLNYEISRERGIKPMSGYEPYDGGVSPSVDSPIIFFGGTGQATLTGDWTTSFPIGRTVTVALSGIPGTFQGTVVYQSSVYFPGGNNTVVAFWFVMIPPVPPAFKGNIGVTITDSVTSLAVGSGFFGGLTATAIGVAPSALPTVWNNFYATIAANIQNVPGQGPINGLFWLRDKLYATRDLFALNFTTGTTNQPNPGDVIYQGASLVASTWSGVVARVVVNSGSFGGISPGTAAGVIMVYNVTGSLLAAAVNNNTQSINSNVAALTTTAVSQAGGMYVATGGRGNTGATASWQWCDLGWSVTYAGTISQAIDMNTALTPYEQLQSGSAGPSIGTTAWKTASAGSANGWQFNGGSLAASVADTVGGLYAWHYFYNGVTSFPQSGLMSLSGFGFTALDIPPNSIINGIEVELVIAAVKIAGATANPIDLNLSFSPVTYGPSPNFAANVNLPGTSFTTTVTAVTTAQYANFTWATRYYGGTATPPATSLLGYYGLRGADIVSAGFSFQFAVGLNGTQTAQSIQFGVDRIRVRASYVAQANFVYFWNANATSPSAVIAQVVMHYDANGQIGASASAFGTMYFQFVQSNGTVGGQPSRVIFANEQIRTYPTNGLPIDGGVADGSSLITTTATAAAVNLMDWSALLGGQALPDGSLSAPSKYKSITRNFTGSSTLDAIYGVSGGGPAFFYDGIKTDYLGNRVVGNFSRIHTGLPAAFETPRDICEHQGALVVSYATGLVQWSNLKNVLSYNPLLFDRAAGNVGIGDVITAISSINGSALFIGGLRGTKMLQGNIAAPTSLSLVTVAETGGCIEYSMQPAMVKCYADYHGISSLASSSNYGDLEATRLSHQVSPFLLPRVQSSAKYEAVPMSVINSALFGSKSQYRLYFKDGYVLTATFFPGEAPQFTTQLYTRLSHTGSPNTVVTWDVLLSVTESSGRERVFGASSIDSNGAVYELDRGRTFVSVPGFTPDTIVASATIAPDCAGAPYKNKLFGAINVFGKTGTYAQYTIARSGDYTVSSNGVINGTLSLPFASTIPMPVVSIPDAPLNMEGTAIGITFGSAVSFQDPYTLQALSYNIEPQQDVTQ